MSVLVFLSVSVTVNDHYILYIIVFQALETAEMYDRVHLRTTYYNYARHLESKGDINGAIPKYAPYHLLDMVFVKYLLSNEAQIFDDHFGKYV